MLLALIGIATAWEAPPAPENQAAVVCFMRRNGIFGSSDGWMVHADGRQVVSLRNKRVHCVDAQPGEYAISVRGTFSVSSTMNVGSPQFRGSGNVTNTTDVRLEDWLKLQLQPNTLTILNATYRGDLLLWEAVEPESLAKRKLKSPRMRDVWLDALTVARP